MLPTKDEPNRLKIKRFGFPILILCALGIYYFFGAKYVSIQVLANHFVELKSWVDSNFIESSLVIWLVYCASVALSLPIAFVLSLTIGALFGSGWGLLLVVTSATAGSMLVFIMARSFFQSWRTARMKSLMDRICPNLNKNLWSFLFFLRLVPIFPFMMVNIALALLDVPFLAYFITTLLGIIPGSYLFLQLSATLSNGFINSTNPEMPLFTNKDYMVLLLLAILSLLPIVIKKIFSIFSKKNA